MVDPLGYFSLQPVLHDWYKKAVVCAIYGMMYKRSLVCNQEVASIVMAVCFFSCYLNGPLPYS